MKMYQKKWEGIRNMTGRICLKIMARLDELSQDARHCYAEYAGDWFFQVTFKQKQYVVNLVRRTCGCRQWDMTGIPCAHAISAIWADSAKPVDYISDWYTMDMVRKAYDLILYLMPDEEQWTKTNNEHVDPPVVRIQPGRPRVVRTRGPDEPKKNQYRMRKGGVAMRCSRCRATGHNATTCPNIRIEAINYKGRGRSEVNLSVMAISVLCLFPRLDNCLFNVLGTIYSSDITEYPV